MTEQIQHVRPHEAPPTIPFGERLLEVGESVEHRLERDAEATIRRVLAMRDHPGKTELARFTDLLLTYCTVLANGLGAIPAGGLCMRGQAALAVWEKLREDGPADGPLGSWSYPRHLAYCARDMVTAIREYRQNAAAAAAVAARFVGRADAPPVPAAAP